jgi:hypothetical protein
MPGLLRNKFVTRLFVMNLLHIKVNYAQRRISGHC